jgi:hypothetical protein
VLEALSHHACCAKEFRREESENAMAKILKFISNLLKILIK